MPGIKVEFVGGPLDGEGEVDPLQNALRLTVADHPEGFYVGDCYSSTYIWTMVKPEERPNA